MIEWHPTELNAVFSINSDTVIYLTKEELAPINHWRMSRLGAKHSQETKDLLRERSLEWYSKNEVSAETREKLRQNWLGRKHTEESKALMSQNMRGIKRSEQARKNISLAQKGKTYSEEYKRNMELATAKKIYRITFDDGRVEIVKGLNRWSKDNGYQYVNIQYVRSGRRKTHKDIIKVEKLEK